MKTETRTMKELLEAYVDVSTITALIGTPEELYPFTVTSQDIDNSLQTGIGFYYGYIVGLDELVISTEAELVDAYFDADDMCSGCEAYTAIKLCCINSTCPRVSM